MLVMKEPVEDKIRTTSVLFGLVLLLGAFFFWKIVDLSNQLDAVKQDQKEDVLVLNDDLKKTQKRIIDMQGESQQTHASIEKVQGEIVASKKIISQISANIASLKAQAKKLASNQTKSSKTDAELVKTQKSLNEALAKLDAGNTELARLQNQSKQMTQTITNLTNQLDELRLRIDSKPVPSNSEVPVFTDSKTSTKPWWKFWSKD